MEMENNIIELASEILYCPYCGCGDDLERVDEERLTCNGCGRDFTVMTHE